MGWCSSNCILLVFLLQLLFSPCPQGTLGVPSFETLAKYLYRQGHFVSLWFMKVYWPINISKNKIHFSFHLNKSLASVWLHQSDSLNADVPFFKYVPNQSQRTKCPVNRELYNSSNCRKKNEIDRDYTRCWHI